MLFVRHSHFLKSCGQPVVTRQTTEFKKYLENIVYVVVLTQSNEVGADGLTCTGALYVVMKELCNQRFQC